MRCAAGLAGGRRAVRGAHPVRRPRGGRRGDTRTRRSRPALAGADAHLWHDVAIDLLAVGRATDRSQSCGPRRTRRCQYPRRSPSGAIRSSSREGADPPAVRRPLDRGRRAPSRTSRRRSTIRRRTARALAAPRPPLEARLPAVPGLLAVDRRAGRSRRALPARVVSGRLDETGDDRDALRGTLDRASVSTPPRGSSRATTWRATTRPSRLSCLLILRKSGAVTAGFVNNFFMSGVLVRRRRHGLRTPGGLPLPHARHGGDHPGDTVAWLDAHRSDRFFLFVNYNSAPRASIDPPCRTR